MARLSDTASWSLRSRVLVAVLVPLVAAAVLVLALIISNHRVADSAAGGGVTTAAPAPTVVAAPKSYAPVQPVGPVRAHDSTTTPAEQRGNSAPTIPDRTVSSAAAGGADQAAQNTVTQGSDGIGSYDTHVALAAKQAAADWVTKSMSMAYTDDFTARTRTLAAMLLTPNDSSLAQWLTPSTATVQDLRTRHTTITVQALVTRATRPATARWAFDISAVQIIRQSDRGPQTVAAPYVVTVTLVDGVWKVVSMAEAVDVGAN